MSFLPAGGPYAVIDVETTGLDPLVDSILECALLELDGNGVILNEWSTLICAPGATELGATKIHGITRTMVENAPHFSEVISPILTCLQGRTTIGHVLSFDIAFLEQELARASRALPDQAREGVCTCDLAREHLDLSSRSLASCCEAVGVPFSSAHSALSDARATAGLFRYFIDEGLVRASTTSNEPRFWPIDAARFGQRFRGAKPRPDHLRERVAGG